MKIFVDENIPAMTVLELRNAGHDVADIRGTENEGMNDESVQRERVGRFNSGHAGYVSQNVEGQESQKGWSQRIECLTIQPDRDLNICGYLITAYEPLSSLTTAACS